MIDLCLLSIFVFLTLQLKLVNRLTLFASSDTSASVLIEVNVPLELFEALLLPWIIKLVCFINFLAFGESRKRSERGTDGSCDDSLFDKFVSGHILCNSLIPSLTVERLWILSSFWSIVGTKILINFLNI